MTTGNPLRGPVQRVTISRIENGAVVSTWPFEMNPTTLDWGRSANWVDLRAPGTTSNQAMFVNCSNIEFTLKFLIAEHGKSAALRVIDSPDGFTIDESFANKTMIQMAEVESWTLPSLDRFSQNQYQYIPPPSLVLTWGSRQWKCYCSKVDFSEVLHNNDLQPIIVECTATFRTFHDTFTELQNQMEVLRTTRNAELFT